MARGLDHVVHAVADLDAAAAFYRACGFQVGARNRHPWGTHNHVVQLPGFFIEILTVAEPEKLGDDGLSCHFGAFQQRAIAAGDGLSMLVLESTDIDADVRAFAADGIGASGALPFERQATLPDGSSATVGFSLAFVRDGRSSGTGFATCQQHRPEAFWSSAYQNHPNGAAAVTGVVLAAARPADQLEFVRAFTGATDVETRLDGFVLHTPRGDVEVQNVAAFAERTGHAPDCGDGAVLSGLRLAVASLDDLEHRLRGENLPARRAGFSLVVPPQAAFGATLMFEQAALS